jgi:hypothetical protein
MVQPLLDYCDSLAATKQTSIPEEQPLLQRLAQGDTTDFWAPWEQYEDFLCVQRCFYGMGGHHEDAEDALKSASPKAWQQWPAHASKVRSLQGGLLRLLHTAQALYLTLVTVRKRVQQTRAMLQRQWYACPAGGRSAHRKLILLKFESMVGGVLPCACNGETMRINRVCYCELASLSSIPAQEPAAVNAGNEDDDYTCWREHPAHTFARTQALARQNSPIESERTVSISRLLGS